MQANHLRPPKGAKHAKKRVGRGNASGHGTYSTRGLKGQKSRAGRKPRRFFEGGQTEMMRRLPRKRGFTNVFRVEFTPVNLRDLDGFDAGSEITPEILKEAGVISTLRKPVKILGTGEITRKLTVTAHKFSMAARGKIEAAGGSTIALIEDEPGNPNTKKRRLVKGAANAEARARGLSRADVPEEKEEEPESEEEPKAKAKGKKGATAVAEETPENEAAAEEETEADGDSN
jgi:large subunit ribosomal protein L15